MAELEGPIFDGYIKHFSEKPGGLTVDNFEGKIVEHYFISHAHTDHFKGLENFQEILCDRRNKSVIYCTEETGSLILSMAGFDRDVLAPKFRYKKLESSFTIKHGPGGIETKVKFVPANHIPGSVMILFEDSHYKALYTGDFRFESYERSEVTGIMKRFLNNTKNVDFLYLDVQFLDLLEEKRGTYYPGKKVILEELEGMIKKETGHDEEFDDVHIDCNILGWQEVAAYLAYKFDSSVGISEDDPKSLLHERIFDLLPYRIRLDRPENSFIHIFSGDECSNCTDRTMRIRPSVRWTFYCEEEYDFRDRQTWVFEKDPEENPGFFNVLFTCHCSDYELHQFMKLVKLSDTAEVYPINRPAGQSVDEMSNSEIKGHLRRMFRKYFRPQGQDYGSSSKRRRFLM